MQQDISETLSARPRVADTDYFAGKVPHTTDGDVTVTDAMAKQIYRYLVKNDYTDAQNILPRPATMPSGTNRWRRCRKSCSYMVRRCSS